MDPVVSIIIPSYNTAALIGRAIESALAQTLSRVEIIVVDDASTDDSVTVVKRFSDSRIRLIELPANQGAGAARNRAIDSAKGTWIAVLDSDDWYTPQRLERLVEVAEAEDADIVADDLYLIREGESAPWSTLLTTRRKQGADPECIGAVDFVDSETSERNGLGLGWCKPVFRRAFLMEHGIRYDPTITVTQDFWMLLECLIRGARFLLLPEPHYFYLLRAGSLVSSSRNERLIKDCEVCAEVLGRTEVLSDPRLKISLENKYRMHKNLLAYHRVVAPLKEGRLVDAALEMVRHPRFLPVLLRRFPDIVKRRFHRYVLRNEAAFSMFYDGKCKKR